MKKICRYSGCISASRLLISLITLVMPACIIRVVSAADSGSDMPGEGSDE